MKLFLMKWFIKNVSSDIDDEFRESLLDIQGKTRKIRKEVDL